MSTDTSVPQPRVAGLDVSDSALLATLLREAPIGFAFFGTDLRFRRINRSLARLHGRNGSDHLGLLPSQVWPESLAARAETAIHHVLADDQPLFEPDQSIGGPSAGDGRADRSPGTTGTDSATAPQARHWAFSWFPSHDPEGEISGVALIAVDVTERRNSEEAVRRSEERYRSLVQAGAQVVWVTTPTGQIAEDSPEWRWITGQSLEEYLGSGWLDAVHPEDRERVERDWADCVLAGKVFDNRYRVRTKTTRAQDRSSGTGRSSNGWVPAPMSPPSGKPRRCGAA
jgi:PAS domain S-box-containing protein